MRDFVLPLILHENMTVEFANGKDYYNLNIHQAARQYVEVKLAKGFTLSTNEELWIAFEQGGTHLNPSLMSFDTKTGIYRIRIPIQVREHAGIWYFTIYIKQYYVTDDESDESDESSKNKKYTGVWATSGNNYFTETSAILDENTTTIPNEETIKSLYDTAVTSSQNAENSAKTADSIKQEMQRLIDNATVGFVYDENNEELKLTVTTDKSTQESQN